VYNYGLHLYGKPAAFLMKKFILHIVLLSYSIVMLKPAIPYVSDFVGHVFFYAKHMATVHKENGKYHVHFGTAKTATEENSGKTPAPSSKKETSTNEHIITTVKQPAIFIATVITKYPAISPAGTVNGAAKNNYPPPRA
jgi:hypothetical protein